jgi:hypothetical protein
MKNKQANRRLFWIVGTVSWGITGWWLFFPPSRGAVEYYFSLRWYRWLLGWITPVTQAFQFPAIVLVIAALLILLNILWFRSWNRGGGKAALLQGFRNLFLMTPLLLVWFVGFWGAGYRRIPIEQRLGLETSEITHDEAARLQSLLLEAIERNVTPVHERNVDRAIASIATAMARTVERWESQSILLPRRVKSLPKGLLLSGGVSGLCSPFTLEPIVDGGLPNASFVSTSAHELGHVAGYCPEDEATFIGFVAGLQAEDRFARYCCALNAYLDLILRLNSSELQLALQQLPDMARQDLLQSEKAYRKYRIALIDKLQTRTYDKYLKTQGIHEGVKNYSRGILLLGFGWRKGLIHLE